MNEEERKAMLLQTFNTVSDGYDNRALRFFGESARLLVAERGGAVHGGHETD